MKFTGKAAGVSMDYSSGTYTISFLVNETAAVLNGYDSIKDMDKLDISVVKHRKKRSLDANAYAWVLISKISDVFGTSKDEVYEIMLQRYGFSYEDEKGYITVTLKADVDIALLGGHWKLIKDNGKYKGYMMIKGSSEYNTAEMSRFIDGIVSEAKEMGIETMTPDEIERMKGLWGKE